MRTPEEVMDAILDFARQNDNIRIVGMEGSRVNRNIPMDSFQDFDVTYFVTNPGQLTGDDGWLSRFGKIIMMQKPEDMEPDIFVQTCATGKVRERTASITVW